MKFPGSFLFMLFMLAFVKTCQGGPSVIFMTSYGWPLCNSVTSGLTRTWSYCPTTSSFQYFCKIFYNFILPPPPPFLETNICLNILITFLHLPPPLLAVTLRTRPQQSRVCVFPLQIMSHRGLPKLKLYGFPYLLQTGCH